MKKLSKLYKNLTFTQGAVFTLTLSSVFAIAAPITGINIFSSGQTISSLAVNQNFDILKNAVEALPNGQTYLGVHDASSGAPAAGSASGEYYIITTAGTYNSDSYAVNDWTMWNGSSWDRVPSTNAVTSVFGRTGVVAGAEADYALNLLSDVNTTSPTPVVGNLLTYDGSQWRASQLPTCAGGEVLKSDGSTFSCVTDSAGAGAYAGTANRAVTTDGSGALFTSSTTSTEIDYISGVTSNIQTQLNSKEPSISTSTIAKYYRGDKTFVTLDTSVVPENTNLYFTTARVLSTTLTGFSATNAAITAADNILAALNKTQGQLDNKLASTGGTMSSGTLAITGAATITVPGPVNPNEVANKGYVDSFGHWTVNASNIGFTTGNVGIGTISPGLPLHVIGNAAISGSVNAGDGSPSNPSFRQTTNPTGMYFSAASKIAFVNNAVESMTIDASGKVGIGTSFPTQDFEVAGNTHISGTTMFGNGSASTPSITQNTTQNTGIFFPASTDLGFSTNALERVRIASSGNVGIGTTTPSYTLHINGTSGGTSAFTTISDLRFKKDILRVPNALERILSIDGVTYNFKTNEFPDLKLSHRREMGVIAQKVEKVFPEAVSKDQKGFKSVAYTMLISPIIEAIREMNFKQKKLEKENLVLKNYLCTRDPMAPFCE